MKDNKNIMYFDSDQDFYDFCVVPSLRPDMRMVDGVMIPKYFTFDLSYRYNDALQNGVYFCIKDPNSQIYKHGAVSYRTITKKIDNLLQYFGDKCDMNCGECYGN